jgi:hypothetical protein
MLQIALAFILGVGGGIGLCLSHRLAPKATSVDHVEL